MMTDMEIYLSLTLVPRLLHLPMRQGMLMLREVLDFELSEPDAEQIVNDAPKTKQLVHALHDLGFRPNWIQEYLDLSQPTISYHLATDIKKPYYNRAWHIAKAAGERRRALLAPRIAQPD